MGISEQVKIREALIDEIEADLIGPRRGDTREEREKEKITNRPDQAYLAGVFFPGNWEVEEEEKLRGDGGGVLYMTVSAKDHILCLNGGTFIQLHSIGTFRDSLDRMNKD